MTWLNFTDESRRNYGTTNKALTQEQIRTGCLQRIADATEKMARRRQSTATELIVTTPAELRKMPQHLPVRTTIDVIHHEDELDGEWDEYFDERDATPDHAHCR